MHPRPVKLCTELFRFPYRLSFCILLRMSDTVRFCSFFCDPPESFCPLPMASTVGYPGFIGYFLLGEVIVGLHVASYFQRILSAELLQKNAGKVPCLKRDKLNGGEVVEILVSPFQQFVSLELIFCIDDFLYLLFVAL